MLPVKKHPNTLSPRESAPRAFLRLTALLTVLCVLLAAVPASADYELAYEGTVTAGDTVPVQALYGGRVKEISVRKGDKVLKGDPIAQIATTLNYAPLEGTISGLYVSEGDSADAIEERYGALLYIEPLHRYTIKATSEKAYNSSETKFIHLGETVYLSCTADGSHKGEGIVTALTDEGYTIEVTGGEFYMGEKVGIYRQADFAKESSLGRGTVGRTTPVAVKGSGSVLKLHVKNGDFVERGELLFETVEGGLDGLYSPQGGLTAPIDGIVASVETSAGNTANKGDTIVKLYPLDKMQIEFNLPEEDLFSVSEGDPVNIEFYWDNTSSMITSGKISAISHMSEAESEKSEKMIYKAYVDFEAGEDVRLGMTVTIYPVKGSEPGAEPEQEPAEEPEQEPAEEPGEHPGHDTEPEKDAEAPQKEHPAP